MPDYRDKLTVDFSGGQRIVILQCNASEQKSLVRHHKEDGSAVWLKDHVASRHNSGKPKHLHIVIPDEGVYEVVGQPKLSGFYCFYRTTRGQLYFAPISRDDRTAVAASRQAGASWKDALIALDKKVF